MLSNTTVVVMSKSSKKLKRLVAFDQASNHTGYSVFDDAKLIKWGLLDASGLGDNTKARIKDMIRQINEVLSTYNPDLVIIEGVMGQANTHVLIVLAQLQGCIIRMCDAAGIDYVIYEPTVWRSQLSFAQGKKVKRAELKAQAVEFIRKAYKLMVEEDVCEAICIGLSHLKRMKIITDFEGLVKARNYKEKKDG